MESVELGKLKLADSQDIEMMDPPSQKQLEIATLDLTRKPSLKRERKASKTNNFAEAEIKKAKSLENQVR